MDNATMGFITAPEGMTHNQKHTVDRLIEGFKEEFRLTTVPEGPGFVMECDFMLACPPSQDEQQGCRAWDAIREGRKAKKQVIVVYPDGFLAEDAPGPLSENVDA